MESSKPAAVINQFLQLYRKILPSAPERTGVWVPPVTSEKSYIEIRHLLGTVMSTGLMV